MSNSTNLSVGPEFDFNGTLQRVLVEHPPVTVFPIGSEERVDYLCRRFRRIRVVAYRCKTRTPDATPANEWAFVTEFFLALHKLSFDELDPRIKSVSQVDRALGLVFDPGNCFPADYASVAKHLHDQLEQQNWGEGNDESPANLAATRGRQRGGGMAATAPVTATARVRARAVRAADDDPIYGLQGIMHHILHVRGPQRFTYEIANSWQHVDAKFFGHGPFQVGQSWPNQIALLRDGGHGMRMAGISGNSTEGTYSIVVSGMYGDLNHDQGETIFYSGSNSLNNLTRVPPASTGTSALERSIATSRPVRVFRSSTTHWEGAPTSGYRYDGLYQVMSFSVRTNEKGGAYKRFRIERLGGQAPINRAAPSAREVSLFSRVPLGYSRTRPRRAQR